MAEYAEPRKPKTQTPPISQETLAEMIGKTLNNRVHHRKDALQFSVPG
jgi:hypothetical protein